MQYVGSKRALCRFLLPIVLADRKPGQWYVEPFVGGANMFQEVETPRLGYDANPASRTGAHCTAGPPRMERLFVPC